MNLNNNNNNNNINKSSNMNGKYIECNNDNKKNIVIVGGGLVGSLAAIHLGKKGYDVNLYEYREDIRTAKIVQGRSINLALSCRGRKALASVGLEEELLNHGIPMKGRMLHDIMGNTKFVAYDSNQNECIYSVGRKFLNEVLLTAAEKYPNIHLNFNQKCLSAKIDTGKLTFLKYTKHIDRSFKNILTCSLKNKLKYVYTCSSPITNENTQITTDLIIGCDGAYSTIRKCMLQKPGFDFSQTYIEQGYLELCIPPKNDTFAMPQNYLHIWPRGKFMMIALPNQDKSWTVTLFMPFSNFEQLQNSHILIEFFLKYFPDALPLIGEERLVKDFFNTKPQHLVSVKCRPLNYGDKVLLMGDAAHAMVPFYGQGMNAGFEDCSILIDILSQCDNDFAKSLETFTKLRWEDAHSICDLAMYNYIEMRDLVTRKSFRARKILDEFLYWIIPKKWIPLYNSVTFSNMSYRKCIENRKWQDKILSRTLIISMFTILGLFTIGYNAKYSNYLYDLLNKPIFAK